MSEPLALASVGLVDPTPASASVTISNLPQPTVALGSESKPSMDLEDPRNNRFFLWKWLCNWTSSSPTMLRAVEKKILSYVKLPYRGFFVDIGPAVGEADKIWTISMNTESKEVPLVLLHGLGAGIALWVMNLDAFAKGRPVYAMDILGFGRSSRPLFAKDALVCEKQFVKSVEEWRREMNINDMILLGHSMGGFIASSYALSHPERVKHLILADPWGFPEKPSDSTNGKTIPLWVRAIARVLTPLNPLWALRAAGPFGQWVVQKTRPDIMRKFQSTIEEDINLLPQYIHQCNAQNPSGESAFHTMMQSFGWAKHPMIHRIKDVRSDIPITFIYGSRSWIDSSSGEKIKSQRGSNMVDIKIVTGAGHHVYADKPDVFNRYVNETCDMYKVASGKLITPLQLIRESTESDEEREPSLSTAKTVEVQPEVQPVPQPVTAADTSTPTADELAANIKPK
ncbi:(Lyso)-N-acylphosphatidylethanolamine lipase isoform X1 [Drosophila sechellia]|uniref:1-acylglycerol-3-phosphate O-acyltransferase ABHD5 n=2 Tax=Drosophila sechellia TaxID=7238 RepID=B4HR81_DROSE|nr:(Lyso)-N-acylphosphatidylethanolamine lipase isoform X1 [Drosophila sechellia]EDW46824.1 GM20984 [Drosophila sechellia]